MATAVLRRRYHSDVKIAASLELLAWGQKR